MKNINKEKLEQALKLLDSQLEIESSFPVGLIICGGSALIAMNLISRTTKDVDIVAMKDSLAGIIDPDPLSDEIKRASLTVAKTLNLPEDWLNTGPVELFRMGLPNGFEGRLHRKEIGKLLTVYYISRLDQIYFKLYASVDRGGYHIDDLIALNPTEDELVAAGKWTKTHDVSDPYAQLLKSFLQQMEYENAAARL